MAITLCKTDYGWALSLSGKAAVSIQTPAGCNDTFEPLGDYALRWTRKTETPVDRMKLTVQYAGEPRYFQVPAVNYNGNGWGSGAQYSGYRCGDTPWSYAWHRIAIPACTYTESDRFAVALFGEEKGGMSCSVYTENGTTTFTLTAGDQVAPTNRIVLEVSCVGRPTCVYVPITLLG